MKNTTKCPLCGGKPEYIEFGCGDGESDLIQCNCGLCTPAGSYPNGEENCWKDWEKLVSKFPPIMRLRQGDNVLVWLSDDIHTVLGTDLALGKIHLQDVYGDADSYYPTGIKKWPWELEQKGGAEQ